ncbi:DUF748 domain-containing protein [Shewanella sp. 10N.286.51.B2]|uniref:DUF748 domain-containing protein n=1 Tax=Shewanella sp. 10N.286.51.B2 TaxID=3229707 RepID=UPI00354F7E8A
MKSSLKALTLAFKQRPRYQKIVIYTAMLYLIFVMILGLLIPFIATKQLPKSLSALLGRDVSIEAIKINPFSFELSVDNINIAEDDTANTFMHINHIATDIMVWKSLFNLDVSLDYLTIDGTDVALARFASSANGSNSAYQYNFSDIVTTLANNSIDEEVKPEPNDSDPISFNINNFTFANANIKITDAITDSALSYNEISILLKQFSTTALLDSSTNANQFSLKLDDNQTGKITLNGQVQLSPLIVNGQLDVNSLSVTPYWRLVDSLFEASLTSADIKLNSTFLITQKSPDTPIEVSLTNTDFALKNLTAKDANRNVASIGLLALNGITVSTAKRSIDINELQTNNADFWLTAAPENINFVNLFSPKLEQLEHILGTSEPAANSTINAPKNANTDVIEPNSNTESEPQWLVTLNKLNLSDYKIEVTESVATELENYWLFSGLSLSTEQFKSDLSLPLSYQLGVDINNQSRIDSSGQFDAKNINLEAELDYQNASLAKLQPYISPFMNITLESGFFSTKGHISADTKDKLIYQGQASIIDLKIKDNLLKQPLLNWQAMTVSELKFDQHAKSLSIDEILFDTLFSRLIIAEDRSTNIADLVVSQVQPADSTIVTEAAPETAPAETALSSNNEAKAQINAQVATSDTTEAAFNLSINRVAFKDSSAFFADNSLTPNFASGIEQLNGEITQLSSNPDTRASVDLAGKIDKYAPVTLKGDVNPLLANPYLDLNLAFNKVELTSVNPYSGTYAGYYIDKGQLSLALNYQLENNQLVGSNHLVIDQLQLGKPTDSSLATSLPITLAIALLQDRHGVIDLGVDVDGDLDSPSFSIGGIVMTAITNVITKAITAPFSLLAGLVGGDDDEMDKIAFDYGQFDITDKQQSTLTSLAKALNDRPLLKLNVRGDVDLVNDQQALQVQQLHQKLAQLAQIPAEELPADLSASQYPQQGPLTDTLIALYQSDLQLDPQLIKQAISEEHPQIDSVELQTRWHIALYNFTLNQQDISEDELGELAQQRANAVKTFLVEQAQIDPSRVFILESRVNTDKNAALATLSLDAN